MLSPPCLPLLLRPSADGAGARRIAAEVLGWPALGGGTYDAGNAVVGLGAEAEDRIDPHPPPPLNPACELEVVPADFDLALRRLAAALGREWEALAGSVAADARGRFLSFHDAAGSLVTLMQPTWRAWTGRSGRRLGQLLRGAGGGDGPEGEAGWAARGSVAVGVTLHVSSLPRALALYRDALGLEPLRVTPREARLDAGPLILTLRAERRVGMVADAARRGALRDRLVFRVGDVGDEAAELASRGIALDRRGDAGRLADPDGHRLEFREAAADAGRGHAPVLERIAARRAAGSATRHAVEAP
ncbi:MAG TPA: VOC family protein [Longimicrobium sp.]|nr:VOC family protein [Longimicrobium sp.]